MKITKKPELNLHIESRRVLYQHFLPAGKNNGITCVG